MLLNLICFSGRGIYAHTGRGNQSRRGFCTVGYASVAGTTGCRQSQSTDGCNTILADPNPGIRAKPIRSLRKLAGYGHLITKEREKLKATCLLILGEDENCERDRAYVVRRGAKETLTSV